MEHVEVILAFVLFIGFLMFGIYFFNPLDSDRVLDSSLFYAIDEVVTNASGSLLTYGISLNESISGAAQNVSFPLSRDEISGEGFFVESFDGTQLVSSYSGGVLLVSRNNSEFFYVRFGDFNPLSVSVPNAHALTKGLNYSISSSDQSSPLSELRLLALNQSYYEDYDSIRTSFNLPRRIDFAVEIIFNSSYEIDMTRPVPAGFDVVAKSERREIVLRNGRVVFADLSVRVW